MQTLDINQIKDIIPHRFPFLLVDKITDIEIGKSAKGVKAVSFNEPFFQGHFPEKPIMPGVLIIEALAQVGSIALLIEPEFKNKIPLFTGIKKAKFRKQVVPGDLLILETELIKRKGNLGVGYGRAYTDGDLCCECELTFFIQ